MGDEQPNYYAIIPADVRYSDIPANAKLLYGEITALSNDQGICWASNEYFANLYKVSKVSISKWIKSLIEKKFISSEMIYKEGSKEILNRYLTILKYPIKEKLNTPIKEKFKDNNTSINNTRLIKENNIKESLSQYGEFKNVCLSEDYYKNLLATYGIGKLNYAIEKLDTWLDNAKQEKKRNQNHRGYFKSNGWVWEGYSEAETSLKLFDNEPVKSIM